MTGGVSEGLTGERQGGSLPTGRWLDDCRRACAGEESPGSTETRCWLTASEGDLRDSATESKPPEPVNGDGKGERVR